MSLEDYLLYAYRPNEFKRDFPLSYEMFLESTGLKDSNWYESSFLEVYNVYIKELLKGDE